MCIIIYLICSIIWCGVFLAFMESKKPTNNKSNKYWHCYYGSDPEWEEGVLPLMIAGFFIWWVIIIGYFIYKIFNKVINLIKNLALKYFFNTYKKD